MLSGRAPTAPRKLVLHKGATGAAEQARRELLHATCDVAPFPHIQECLYKKKRRLSEEMSGTTLELFFFFHGRSQENNPLEGTDKHSSVLLRHGPFNVLSQGVLEDLCVGKDFG